MTLTLTLTLSVTPTVTYPNLNPHYNPNSSCYININNEKGTQCFGITNAINITLEISTLKQITLTTMTCFECIIESFIIVAVAT